MGEASLLGKFYVYRDEDRDAVAVAQWAKGPSGGMMGQTFCRMGVPYGTTTQEDINDRAEFIVKACNAYNDLVAKDAEINALKKALELCLNLLDGLVAESGRDVGWDEEDSFRMGEWFEAHDIAAIGDARALINGGSDA